MTKSDINIVFHSAPADEITAALDTDIDKGLSAGEAAKRLQERGPNKITEEKSKSPFIIFLHQFKSPIVYILLVATAISFWFKEWLDGTAVLVVILVNAVVGFYMEFQAERSMQALKKMAAVASKVFRDGQLAEINSEEIVPGDVVFLEAGDVVPADGRISNVSQLQADEAALTGESIPVEKEETELAEDTPLAERINMLYKGTHITRGNAHLIVCATGMETELGKIAHMVQKSKTSATPLERKLEEFSKRLIKITLALVVIIFVAGLLNGQKWVDMLGTAVALAVAAIPEGLPIVATVALAKGVLKMARHKVIVKKLSAVETLGGTSVICTDKTGTLTQNKIEVVNVATPSGNWDNKEEGENEKNENLRHILLVAVLCNTAELNGGGDEAKEVGDPLETALLKFAEQNGNNIEETRSQYKKVKEESFSSETKLMATLHEGEQKVIYAKGAVEELLKKCTALLEGEGEQSLDDAKKKQWLQESEKLAATGLRVIGAAYRETSDTPDELANDLVFLGLIGMEDPPRPDVFKAIEECKQAGINVVMITGDHPSTARKIGMDLGIITDAEKEVVTGKQMKEFEVLTDDEKKWWAEANVFARVNPKHKLDLIAVFQEKGHTVGMTGDGVNDAPALKKADIGIAMGLRGTQVAQSVASMVLKDDSFSSIVVAIRQGRIIFENIRKFVIYLVSCNLSELLLISVVAILNAKFQLLPLQILFINLITDVLPALALGVTGSSGDIMKKKPRKSTEAIIDKKRWKAIFFYSFVISAASIGAVGISRYWLHSGEAYDASVYNNILFFTLICSQLFHVLNMSSGRATLLSSEVTKNKYVWLAMLGSFAILAMMFFIPPVKEALSLQLMPLQEWGVVVGTSLLSLLVIQLAKRFGWVRQ